MNALKHGMTARIPLLPSECPETFRQHVEGIVASVAPQNALELALAEQAALSLWKIERAQRVEAARVSASIRATRAATEARKQEELAAMGRWLLADTVRTKREAAEGLLAFLPEDRHAPFRAGRGEPLVILLRIEATADGCRWLRERWDQLRGGLERDGAWDFEEMITAAQLRGQRPLYMETSEWECLVKERHVEGNPALREEGRRQLLDQLTEGLAADRAGTAAALRRLVEEETARLEELEAAHEEREAADRSELADRLAVDTTAEGGQVRRHENDCDRKLHRALNSLLKLRRDGVGADPAVEGVPEPAGPVELAGGLTPIAIDVPMAATIPPGAVEPPNGLAPMATEVPVTASGPVEPENRPTPTATDPPAMAAATAGAIEPEDGGEGAHEAAGGAPVAPAAAGADREPVRPNEPTPQSGGGPIRQNEPSPAAGGDPASQNEPGGSWRIAALSVPALALALLILLAAGLSAAFAGPAAGPTGKPYLTLASAEMVPYHPDAPGGRLPLSRIVDGPDARIAVVRWWLMIRAYLGRIE
jgi:hypothetical protein